MCVLCYEFGSDQHWSDALPARSDSALRSRYRRAQLLGTILSPYGVKVTYPGTGEHLLLSNAKGASEVASTLPEVWDRAAGLAGRDFDVLDEQLLGRVEADAERDR